MESAGYVPAIGATSEIGPRASAAKSESVASARKMPLAAGSQSSGQQMRMMSPLMTSQAERKNTPAKVTAKTVEIGPTVREGKWARNGYAPGQRRDQPSGLDKNEGRRSHSEALARQTESRQRTTPDYEATAEIVVTSLGTDVGAVISLGAVVSGRQVSGLGSLTGGGSDNARRVAGTTPLGLEEYLCDAVHAE